MEHKLLEGEELGKHEVKKHFPAKQEPEPWSPWLLLCTDSKHLIQSRELSSCCSCRLEPGLSWAHAPAGAGNRLKPFWLCISVNDWGSQVGFFCYLCLAELYFPVKGARAEFLSHSGISAPALCLLGDGIRVRKHWE